VGGLKEGMTSGVSSKAGGAILDFRSRFSDVRLGFMMGGVVNGSEEIWFVTGALMSSMIEVEVGGCWSAGGGAEDAGVGNWPRSSFGMVI